MSFSETRGYRPSILAYQNTGVGNSQTKKEIFVKPKSGGYPLDPPIVSCMGYQLLFYLSIEKDLPGERIPKNSESEHSLGQQIQEILQEILY